MPARPHPSLVVLVALIAAACRPAAVGEPPPAAVATPTPSDAPAPSGTLGHQVRFEFGGTPMPGCFEADEPFQAVIRSYWTDKVSVNTLTHRWSPSPEGADGIVIRIDGQDLMKRLDPGDVVPEVSLALPLGNVTMRARIVTFVFTGMEADGRACFRWLKPPGTPPDIRVEPMENTEA